MKFAEEIMEILAAFDLTGSYRDAGELAGCSHNTVARLVVARDAGVLTAQAARRAQIVDPYLDKIEEWVELSGGRVRADVAFDRLVAMGWAGSERTARRAVAAAKSSWTARNRRVYRPWVPEPGLWLQCGLPHCNQYAASANMRRGVVGRSVVAGQGGRGAMWRCIFTDFRGKRGAGRMGGSGLGGCWVGRFGPRLSL